MAFGKMTSVTTFLSHAWIIDHCGTISQCEVVSRNQEGACALRVGDRLMIRNVGEVFGSEAAAIRSRLRVLSTEITVRQNQWAELAARLDPGMEVS